MSDQNKRNNFISEIPSNAMDIYRMLPEGTRCEVIFNELVFPNPVGEERKHWKAIPDVPTTAVEVYRMLPEGTRCEVIFNELIMSPSPLSVHQLLLSDLHVLLYSFLKETNSGKIIPSPFDVFLDNYDSVVQPDLLIILTENLSRIKKDGVYGAPDVVIEILSGSRNYDTGRKKALYEKAGVKEYFMIDPENKQTILLTLTSEGIYEQTYEAAGVLNSGILSCSISF